LTGQTTPLSGAAAADKNGGAMSDSETARKAGGNGRGFTSAVIISLLGLIGLFAWRIFLGN
jgi:hypothetical protein